MHRPSRRDRARRPWLALGLSRRSVNILLTADVREVGDLYDKELVARLQAVSFCSQAVIAEVIRLRLKLRSDLEIGSASADIATAPERVAGRSADGWFSAAPRQPPPCFGPFANRPSVDAGPARR